MHGSRQTRLVGVPAHQVKARFRLAQPVAAHAARPDLLARRQKLERATHVAPRHIAFALHALAQRGELVFVDEHAQLAGLGEIGLCGQQQHRCQLRQLRGDQRFLQFAALALFLPRQPAQGGRHDGQEGATQAIAHGVDALRAAARLHRLHGGQHAAAQIIGNCQLAVFRGGVAPRDNENAVALLQQIPHHGVLGRQVQNVVLHDA